MNDPILLLVEELRAGRASVASASENLAQKGPLRAQRRADFTRASMEAGLPMQIIAQALGHRGARG